MLRRYSLFTVLLVVAALAATTTAVRAGPNDCCVCHSAVADVGNYSVTVTVELKNDDGTISTVFAAVWVAARENTGVEVNSPPQQQNAEPIGQTTAAAHLQRVENRAIKNGQVAGHCAESSWNEEGVCGPLPQELTVTDSTAGTYQVQATDLAVDSVTLAATVTESPPATTENATRMWSEGKRRVLRPPAVT